MNKKLCALFCALFLMIFSVLPVYAADWNEMIENGKVRDRDGFIGNEEERIDGYSRIADGSAPIGDTNPDGLLGSGLSEDPSLSGTNSETAAYVGTASAGDAAGGISTAIIIAVLIAVVVAVLVLLMLPTDRRGKDDHLTPKP